MKVFYYLSEFYAGQTVEELLEGESKGLKDKTHLAGFGELTGPVLAPVEEFEGASQMVFSLIANNGVIWNFCQLLDGDTLDGIRVFPEWHELYAAQEELEKSLFYLEARKKMKEEYQCPDIIKNSESRALIAREEVDRLQEKYGLNSSAYE
jgi:hypothetical protein